MARIAFHYIPGNSFLHQWDARCKVLGLLAATVSLLQFRTSLFIINSVMLVGLLAFSRLPLERLLREFRYWLIFLFILFLFQALFSEGNPLAFFPALPVSVEGLIQGGVTVWRLGLLLSFSILFTAATRPKEVRDAIIWFLKPVPFLPERIIGLMVSLTLRFFSIILDQSEEVRFAHQARLGDRIRNPFRKAKSLGLPILRGSFSRAEDVTLALAVRGFRDDLPIHLPKMELLHLAPLLILISLYLTLWFSQN